MISPHEPWETVSIIPIEPTGILRLRGIHQWVPVQCRRLLSVFITTKQDCLCQMFTVVRRSKTSVKWPQGMRCKESVTDPPFSVSCQLKINATPKMATLAEEMHSKFILDGTPLVVGSMRRTNYFYEMN